MPALISFIFSTIVLWSAFAALLITPSRAQVVIGAARMTPAPATTTTVPAAGQPGSASSILSVLGRQTPVLRWGKLVVSSETTYSFLRSDGLLRVPGEPTNTDQHSLSESLSFMLGKTWTLATSLSYVTYSSRLLEDGLDSSVSLSGRWTLDEWSVSATHRFAGNSPIVAETGGQNAERTNSTSLHATRETGAKTSLMFSASRSLRKASPEGNRGNTTWTGSDWNQTTASAGLGYSFSPQVKASASLIYGYDEIEANPDMEHFTPSVQLSWRPTTKWTLSASAGQENRRTRVPGAVTLRTPVYSASLSYSPGQTTTVSLTASKTISTAYFNDQTTGSESWSANLSQRLLERFFFGASYSTGRSNYRPSAATASTLLRSDRYESVNTSLSTAVGKRGSVSISYSESRNKSDRALFRFTTHQFGASVNYRF